MDAISVDELYSLYLDSIGRCTSQLLNRSDEEVEYELFEEFDVGAHSFLHDDSLRKLRDAGYLNDQQVQLSRSVRSRWLDLHQKTWTIQEIRSKPEWQQLFDLCNRLWSQVITRRD